MKENNMILKETKTYGNFTIILRFCFSVKDKTKIKFNKRYKLFWKNIELQYYVSSKIKIQIYEQLYNGYSNNSQDMIDDMFKYILESFNKPKHMEYRDGGIQWKDSKKRFKNKHKILDYIYDILVKSEKDMLLKLSTFNEKF